jgi:hypothetical protein
MKFSIAENKLDSIIFQYLDELKFEEHLKNLNQFVKEIRNI